MPLNTETIKKILGIRREIDLTPIDMAKNLKITFFPNEESVDEEILKFGEKLKTAFINLGVEIIPYNKVLESPSLDKIFKRWFLFFKIYSLVVKSLKIREDVTKFKKSHYKNFFKFIFGKKIKRKIAIISLGENREGFLPIDYTTSFKENPIITVVRKNKEINESSAFEKHIEEALNLFARDMTNLAVCIDEKSWTIYSFNLSNPTLPIDDNFEKNVLNSLIPKISAPVVPPAINDFKVLENNFSPGDEKYASYINDLVESGTLFEKTKLYPAGRKIESLRFKNFFYRWIGAIHLDERNGMSYGFLARQLPVRLSSPLLLESVKDKELLHKLENNECVSHKGNLYVKIIIKGMNLAVEVPEVWVLTSRSGSNKTDLNPRKDIIKIGLKNGQMFLGLSVGSNLSGDYKPSFDTKVILSHAVSNAIFASLLLYFQPNSSFPKILQMDGFAIAHWHGYINPKFIPKGWIVYGQNNPSVSCSSPQAAIYAFQGKEKGIMNNILTNNIKYNGDIHIEPHHGTNMTLPSLEELASFLIQNHSIAELGSRYLYYYQ